MSDLEREIEESWKTNAAAWADVVRQGLIESRRLATNQAILDAILERKPRRILDVGCGEGWLTHHLSDPAADVPADVVGFDSSEELLDRATAGPGTFRLLSYESFAADPVQVGTDYDIAVCNFSLLGRNIGPVIRGCGEVLAAGGRLIVQTPHPFAEGLEYPYEDGWRREDFGAMESAFHASMPWYFRTLGSWVTEIVEGGFALEAVREPMHPESRRPLSLILVGLRS